MGRDRWTTVTFAHVVKGKGLQYDWIVQQVYNDIRFLGYTEIRLRADAEVAIKALLEEVKDLRDHRGSGKTEVVRDAEALLNRDDEDTKDDAGQKTNLDDATPGQPKTNGVAEKAAQDVTTQTRKYKITLESKPGTPIHPTSVIFKRFARHAGDMTADVALDMTKKCDCNRCCTNTRSL